MRPTRNRIIIKAHYDQREYLSYGILKLLMPNRNLLNIDGKEANPTLAEVVAVSDGIKLEPGDELILSHNIIFNKAWLLSLENHIAMLSIPNDEEVLGRLDENGELHPLNGNCIVKRIEQPPVSSIIVTPDAFKKTEENKVILLECCPEEKKLLPGQTVFIFKHSDYKIHWSFKGEEKSAIVCKSDEVVAVLKEAA